jgi:hypothetical protein
MNKQLLIKNQQFLEDKYNFFNLFLNKQNLIKEVVDKMAVKINNSNKIKGFLALKRKQFLEQRGQVAVIIGILIIPLLGMAAYVVDTGSIYSTRRSLQTAADAAALAGAQELPDDAGLATSYAIAVGNENIDSSAGEVINVTNVNGGSITVRAENPNLDMAFAAVLGKDKADVYADATAEIGSPSEIGPITGLTGMGYLADNANYIVPFGILNGSFSPGSDLTLIEDSLLFSSGLNPWNFCPLDIDGSSNLDYKKCVRDGADNSVSIGMSVGTIGWSVGWDVFGASRLSTIDRVTQKKNNQKDSYGSLTKVSSNVLAVPDSQFVICPIISEPSIEGGTVTIVGFAPFIITDYVDGTVDGTSIDKIYMKFLSKAIIMSTGPFGSNPLNGISIIRLTN